MSSVTEIEAAIQRLSREDFAALRDWLAAFDAAAWDDQFEQDVQTGKLDALAEEALGDFEQGRCTEL